MKDKQTHILIMDERYSETIIMLIPKKIGGGFLKSPVGHHHEPWMSDMTYDVDGLDGYLNIECGRNYIDQDAILKEIMPIIQSRFNFPWRIVSHAEFWGHLPTK